MANHKELLKSLSPCVEAFEWYNDQDSYHAWRTCKRGDWLIWVAAKLGINTSLIIHTVCDCIEELTLKHIPEKENRPTEAIIAARKCADNPTEENKHLARAAAYAADAAANAAANAAAYAAANAAANAAAAVAYAADAYAADAAAYAAAYADAAYAAVAYAANADTKRKTLAKCTTIVRKRIPWKLVKEAIKSLPI